MKSNARYVLLIAGMLSGYLSSWLFGLTLDLKDDGFIDSIGILGPGILFGLVIAGYDLYMQPVRSALRMAGTLLFIAISTAAFYMSYMAIFSLTSFGSGVVGSFILLLGTHFLSLTLSQRQFLVLVLLGGILGLSLYIPAGTHDLTVLFVIWQGGMAYALARALHSRTVLST